MQENGIDPTEYYGCDLDEDIDDIEDFTFGVSSTGHNYSVNDKGEISYNKDNPFIVCSTLFSNDTKVLMTFIHEFGHLIKGEINSTYTFEDKDYVGYVIRTGLDIYQFRYYPASDEFSEDSSYQMLDEAINCLQTTEAGIAIALLEDIIVDEDILNFYKALNKDELCDNGYACVTSKVAPLWKNESFKMLILENIIVGDINSIIESFDKTTFSSAFDEFDELLSEIDELDLLGEVNSKKMKKRCRKVEKIITKFNQKSKSLVK